MTHGSREIEHAGEATFTVHPADAVRDEIDWRRELYQRVFERPWTETKSEILARGDGY
jgi:hypothetical protein